jgi:peptide chain release factor 1
MGTLEEKLAALSVELDQLSAALSEPDAARDTKTFKERSRRHRQLTDLVGTWHELTAARADVEAATELLIDAQGEERAGLEADRARSTERVLALESRLEELLVPDDPNAGRDVLVEIRGAEGGEEANLFARDLYDMYLRFGAIRGLKVEVLEERDSERGGIDEVIFKVSGEDAWARFEHETGTHRVQRVPVTESKGRIHTSAATVTVLPEADEVDVAIDPADIKVDVYRSSGPGGQSVNTTDSAVRVTHVPTGIVVSMQDEKSQLQNRAKAMVVLRSRLMKRAQDEQAAKEGALRRQAGTGSRGEKIRTYHFKENRVTDHRVGLTLYKLDAVLAGQLDEFVDALIADKRARQLDDDHGD